MKRLFVIIILTVLLITTGCQTPQMAGATASARTLVIPVMSDYGYGKGITTLANTYAILETASGLPVVEDTGALTTYTAGTYSAIAIDGSVLESGTNVGSIGYSIPALDTSYRYRIRFCENATPALATIVADTFAGPYWYKDGILYTDTNPIYRDSVIEIGRPYKDGDTAVLSP